MRAPPRLSENETAQIIVDSAFRIHQTLRTGLLESVYEAVLTRDLERRGCTVQRQKAIPIRFEDMVFDEGFRADLVVNDAVIVEVKSVVKPVAVFKSQLLTYLRMSGLRLGLLINFGEPFFKDAVFRVVNGLQEPVVELPNEFD